MREAYFSNLPDGAGRVLETAGWGWHSEVAVHVLRMVVAGTLDKHPKLKLIIGHMGEMLPMMLDRASQVFSADIDHLKRSVPQTVLDQVWITTSGIFNEPPLYAAMNTFGIDRVMFSIDYSVLDPHDGPRVPQQDLARAGRYGEVLPRHRRRTAEAESALSI